MCWPRDYDYACGITSGLHRLYYLVQYFSIIWMDHASQVLCPACHDHLNLEKYVQIGGVIKVDSIYSITRPGSNGALYIVHLKKTEFSKTGI